MHHCCSIVYQLTKFRFSIHDELIGLCCTDPVYFVRSDKSSSHVHLPRTGAKPANRFLFSFNREHFDGLPEIDHGLVSILQQSIDGDLHLAIVIGDAVQPIVGKGAESSVCRVVVAALQGGPSSMTYLRWICRERYQ